MEQARLEVVECNLCGGQEATSVLIGCDLSCYSPGEFRLVKCEQCGLVFLSPRPTLAEMERYYPETYGPHQEKGDALDDGDAAPWRQALRRLAFGKGWLACLPKSPVGKRLLEIGCADGTQLHRLRSAGWMVAGVDTAKGPVARARARYNLDVFCGELHEAKFPDAYFDVIIGGMVLEHLHDPLGCMREARRILKPDGLLLVATPNIDSLEFFVFRNWWHGLELPRHLYHFTPKTVRRLLECAGFSIARLRWPRNPNNIIYSMRYILESTHHRRWVSRILKVWRIENRAIRYLLSPLAAMLSCFRTGGRIVIVARPCAYKRYRDRCNENYVSHNGQ